MWRDLAQDGKQAVRMLVKSPGFTFVAVLSLALAIGANATLFGLVDRVLLKPMPGERHGELVSLYTNESDGAKAGNAGVSSNTPPQSGGDTTGKGTGKSSEQIRKNKSLNYEINHTTLSSVRAPGTVSRVTAAVFVASKATPRTPAELDSLRKMVVNALGVKATDEKEAAKIVSLEEVSFENPPAVKAGILDLALSNTDLVKNGVAVLVAVVMVLFFLRMVKKAKPDEIPIEVFSPIGAGANGADQGAQPISVELINEMIRQKPENVGAALRDWMSTTNGNN